jgi:toxin HigB-1
MIHSFSDKPTEELWEGHKPKQLPPAIHRTALKKLMLIDQSTTLADLRVPPGNRLEAPKGDRLGEHSIRINDQWRVCFRWEAGSAHDVEISKHYE